MGFDLSPGTGAVTDIENRHAVLLAVGASHGPMLDTKAIEQIRERKRRKVARIEPLALPDAEAAGDLLLGPYEILRERP